MGLRDILLQVVVFIIIIVIIIGVGGFYVRLVFLSIYSCTTKNTYPLNYRAKRSGLLIFNALTIPWIMQQIFLSTYFSP